MKPGESVLKSGEIRIGAERLELNSMGKAGEKDVDPLILAPAIISECD